MYQPYHEVRLNRLDRHVDLAGAVEVQDDLERVVVAVAGGGAAASLDGGEGDDEERNLLALDRSAGSSPYRMRFIPSTSEEGLNFCTRMCSTCTATHWL